MKKWSEVVDSEAYQALAPDEQNEARQDYFRTVIAPQVPQDDRGTAWGEFDAYSSQFLKSPPQRQAQPTAYQSNPVGDEFTLQREDALAAPAREEKPMAERSWREVVDDTWISLQKGVGGLISSALTLDDLANPVKAYSRLKGDDTTNKNISAYLSEHAKELEQGYSKKRQQQGGQFDKTDGFADATIFLLQNPTFVSDMVAESAPGTVVAGKAGNLAARITEAATVHLEKALAQKAIERGAAWGSGASEALQSLGDVANDIEEKLDRAKITDPGKRAQALSMAVPAALATLAFGRLGGGVESKLFGHVGDGAGGLGFKAGAKAVGKDMVKEGILEELPQSAGEQFFTNVGANVGGVDTDLMQGVGKAAAAGMVTGAAQGGGISVLHEVRTASRVQLTGNLKDDLAALVAAPITPVVQPSSTTVPSPGPSSPASVVADAGVTEQDAAAVTSPSVSTIVDTSPSSVASGDLLRPSDQKPFGSASAARLHAESEGLQGYEPVAVPHGEVEGYVLRKSMSKEEIDARAHEAATSPTNDLAAPTKGQQDAGNYKLGHVTMQGLDISIENPAGSERSGIDAGGNKWSVRMQNHYGYIKGTTAADSSRAKKQGVDAFIGPNPQAKSAFVVDQVNKQGTFDEHKVMLGFDSQEQADKAYHSNYAPGWTGRGAITEMPMADFHSWVRDPKQTRSPVSALPASSSADTNATITPAATTESASAPAPEAPQNVEQVQQDTTAVNVLNQTIQAAAKRAGATAPRIVPAAPGALSDTVSRTARQLGDILGKRVVAVEAEGGKPAPFDGVVLKRALPNHIFVDAKNVSPVMVVGHETVHHIRQQHPDLYKEVVRAISSHIDAAKHEADYRESAAKVNDKSVDEMSSDKVLEELVADLHGNRLTEKSTWAQLAHRVPETFRKFAQLVIDRFDTMIGRAKKNKSDQYVIGDMEAVRGALVEMLSKYAERNPEGNIDVAGEGEAAATPEARGLQYSRGVRGSEGSLAVDGGQDQGTREALAGAPTEVDIPGRGKVFFGISEKVRAVKRAYAEKAGLPYVEQTRYAKVDRARAEAVASEYDAMVHAPNDPEVKAAYEAMAKETIAQYEAILEHHPELKIEFIDYAKDGDPYAATPRLAILDVLENNHFAVFSTRDGYGSSSFDPSASPMLAETKHKISGQTALVNDLFRVVHDYFGPRRAARTAWVNYGPHGEANRAANGADTIYADQKVDVMPDWVSTDGAFDSDEIAMRRKDREGDAISTRNPTGKRSTENAVMHLLTVDLETMKRDTELFAHNVGLITKYIGYRNEGARSPAQKAERFVKQAVDNLLWLHDQMKPELRNRAKLWYDGANKIAKQFSRDYGVSARQSAGVLAALSPQKDWFQNVSLAKRVMETFATQQKTKWTPEMQLTSERIFPKDKDREIVDAIRGKSLGELTDPTFIEHAAWVRTFDEAHNARSYPVVTPEGSYEGLALNGSGSPTKAAWGTLSSIAKSISIFKDGSVANISARLGEEHKVRSFYNNIIDPTSPDGHVTIDTHAVAASLLRPLTGKSIEVLHNFGNTIAGEPGPSSSKVLGLSGLYAVYAEAYRRAAEQRGLLPREMQSITWEAVRGLFSYDVKRTEMAALASNVKAARQDRVDTIEGIWEDYSHGDVTLEQARTRVLKLAGGINAPEWAGGRPAADVDGIAQDSGDAGEVSRAGVPGRDAEAVDSGAGSTAAAESAAADDAGVAFSRKFDSAALTQSVKDRIEAAFNTKRSVSLWDRTVGTKINLARKSPEFKRVFDKANEFIRDISFFAARAADQAPNLLPKLESVRTLGKGLLGTMTGERQKAITAAGEAVFQGTLNKQTFTDAELQRRGLNEQARTFYSEARKSVDTSLEQTATSIMHRMARAEKLGVEGIREMTMMQAREAITKVVKEKRDAVHQELARAQELLSLKSEEYAKQLSPEALAATLKKASDEVQALQNRYNDLVKMVDDVNDVAGRVIDLQNEGYFPLMRFGDYTVYATSPEGDQLFFGMYETEAERVKMARELRALYPTAKVVEGVGNDEYHKLFSGINLDSLEVFAEAMGASEQQVFQSYLKLAVANRSALKRMIERKSVPGFDKDISRTLAHFITSNARLASRNYHWAEAKQAALAIPKEKGDVQKEAVKLLSFIENPEEEAQTLRALNFLWFMAGNISTAVLNLTQPAMTTFPYLSRYGVTDATAALAHGAKTLSGKGIDAELAKALKLAAEKGITQPHEIHQLYGQQQRTPGVVGQRIGAIWQRGNRLIGEPFALAEAFNRHVTFVAAFEIGRKLTPAQLEKEAVADAFGFAMKAVDDTQFVYNKANRPNWGRGSIQSLIFQFKNYSISSVELFAQLALRSGPEGKRAAAIMFAMWLLAAGFMGLPYEEDIEDLIDTIGQSLGFDTNVRASLRDGFYKGAEAILGPKLGEMMAEVMMHGASGILPIDVQARLSFSNMIPATGVLKRSAEGKRGKELAELLGPSGGLINAMFEKVDAFQSGEDTPPVAFPSYIRNVMQAKDMMQTGFYRDAKGGVSVKTDSLDAAIKALGFQPAKVAKEQRKMSVLAERLALQKVAEKDFVERAARSLADAALIDTPEQEAKAEKAMTKVLADIESWNTRNPDTPVEITSQQVRKRVHGMLLEKSARMLKSAPREMKGIIARDLYPD
jgi:hypothetical protein